MKLNSTSIFRVLFFSLCLLCFHQKGFGQPTGINYVASNPAGGLVWNGAAVGGTILPALNGADDVLSSFTLPANWGGFYFGGVWYPQATTTIYVSSNGWMSICKPGDPVPPSSLPVNSLGANPYRIIAPLWDDLRLHATGGGVSWKVTGGLTTRTLTVEWRGVYWDRTGSDTAIAFQARIYDNLQATAVNRNSIEFRYKRNGAATYGMPVPNTLVSASIGLSGFCDNDVYAWTNAAGTVISKNVPEAVIQTKPSDPASYRFTPVAHPNDECASPFALTFNVNVPNNTTLGTLLHSTLSAPLPIPACGGATTTNFTDVWYSFTKPANITNFEIFTDSLDCRGTTYGTGIEVFTACGTPLAGACDFGSAGPAATNASSYLNLTGLPCGSTPYLVRVFAPDTSARGYFRLNIRPPGRTCAFANDITVCGLPYSSPSPMSNCGFGNEYDSLYAACHSRVQHGEDYVFSYTPAVTQCVNFSLINTPANSNPGLFIYANGCPSIAIGGSEVCYGNVASAGGTPLSFNNVTLTAGQTYYFVVDNDSSGATACLNGWSLNITVNPGPGPTYDNCATYQPITVQVAAACVTSTAANNNCATPSAPLTVPTPCGFTNFTDGITPDVWFRFISSSTQPHQITVGIGAVPSAQDLSMAVYTGTCGALALVLGACDDNSNGLMPSLSIVPSAAGVPYYVRVWSNNGTRPGNFTFCVVQGCTPPNDLCSGVVTLSVAQPLVGDNGCSTGTGEPSSGTGASCWTNSGGAGQLHTVWYNFVATNTQMRIRLRLLTMFDSQMALYSSTGAGANTCSGTFTQIFCNDNGPNTCGSGGTIRWSEITATGLGIGNTYFLRVDGLNANTGTFELTVMDGTNPFPPINIQDCSLAQNICGGSNLTVADPGYQGTGNVCDMPNGGSTCMAAGERGASWYLWTMTGAAGTGTDMNFLITPNAPNDYDFILYLVDTTSMMNGVPGGDGVPAVANYCGPLTTANAYPAVACNWSACGTTGCNTSAGTLAVPGGSYQGGAGAACIIPAIHLPPGMTGTFLLQVSNYTTSTSGFTLSFPAPTNAQMGGTPPSMTWNGAANTTTWGTVANWNPSNCGVVPSCANQINAFIGIGACGTLACEPNLVANTIVKDITINPGATLTISPNITLQVCGNFTNNGTLVCGNAANVTFIGNTNQSINGTFAAASNNFYNLIIQKGLGTLTFNTNIYCQGNFSVTGPTGIVNVNLKNIEVGGNFYNYNGNTSLTGLGSGVGGSTLTFTRRSTVNQLFQNDGTPLVLNNVNVRQQIIGGTITLNSNATSDLIIGTAGILSLGTGGLGQEGVIVTPAGTARMVNVRNSSPAACNAGSNGSYVSGKLRRMIATGLNTYEFPVGDIAKGYERASINYTAAPTAVYSLLAQFKTWGGSNCAFPAGNGPAASECVTATYNNLPYFDHGYWNIDADSGVATGTYRATMYNTAMTNNTGMGWTVVKGTSGSCAFSLTGNCWAGSTAGATRRDGLTGFSDFATVQSQTPLPIELLTFDAKTNNLGVLCSWVTATETNNDHFDVERSKDASNFRKIGEMKGFGAGTSVHNMEYKFQDEDVCTGTIYYRLKQVDIDGRYSYSDVVAVSCKNSLVSIAPNPARTTVNINFYEPQNGNVTIEVSDLIGQILITKLFDIEKGYNDRTVDISSLANGVYYLKIINRNGQPEEVAKQIKFLKY